MAMRIMRGIRRSKDYVGRGLKTTTFRFQGNLKRYIYGVGIIFVKLNFENQILTLRSFSRYGIVR